MTITRRQFGLGGIAIAGCAVATVPFTGCSTSWIEVAEQDLPVVVNIASVILQIVADATGNAEITPAVSVLITEAANVFSSGLEALSAAVAAYKVDNSASNLDKVIALLKSVQQDAPKVIQTITQVPSNLVSVITAGIGTAISLLSAIMSLLPKAVLAKMATVSVPVTTKVELPNAVILKGQFNSVLSVYGFGNRQIK